MCSLLLCTANKTKVAETDLQLDIFTFITCVFKGQIRMVTLRVSQGQGTPGQQLNGEGLLGIV